MLAAVYTVIWMQMFDCPVVQRLLVDGHFFKLAALVQYRIKRLIKDRVKTEEEDRLLRKSFGKKSKAFFYDVPEVISLLFST